MLEVKLLHIFLISALVVGGILLQPAFTGFFAYTVGFDSRLEVWDSTEQQGGGENAFINEPVTFFANFTNLTSSQPINGSGIFCEITFNISGDWSDPESMTYDESLTMYKYNRTFNLMGNYSWNVSCDGSAQGYDVLNVTDSDGVMVHRYEWWNNSWKYRLRIEVGNGDYNVTDWPMERDVNFTDVLRQLGISGTFDENSTRLVEHNSTGGAMHEIPSQFDNNTGYNETENAAGTFIFIMNGTTGKNTKRYFYIYFDVLESGAKEYPNYSTNLTYKWSGDEIHFNNSRVAFYLDTNRSENTSGLYSANFIGETAPFFYAGESDRTVEYVEYSNGTNNFSFDFRHDVTIVQGPVRLTITQAGEEIIFGNTSLKTGEGKMIKKYYIYNKAGPEEDGTWIKAEQNYTNLAAYSVDRNSTQAGALAFDIERGWQGITTLSPYGFLGNETDPYSWYLALADGSQIVGLVNLKETVPDFSVTNMTAMGRVGVQLANNAIDPGDSIVEKAAVYVGRGGSSEFVAIKNALRSPPTIEVSGFEQRTLDSYTQTDHDMYNRNETIFILVNITYDPYSLVNTVNVTLNNGTASPDDDINLTMHDDGTHGDENASDNVYANHYNISDFENIGDWTALAFLFDENLFLLNQSQKNFTITKTLFVNATVLNKYGDVDRTVNATVDVMNYRQDIWQPSVTTLNCSVFEGSTHISDVGPENITDYNNGSYSVNFTAPSHFGNFVLNCSATKAGNDGYGTDSFYAEETETKVSIVVTPGNFTAENVTWLHNQSFLITVNATNTANGTAYNATINLQMPENLTSNGTTASCKDKIIPISESCVMNFNITVLSTTAPENFTVIINVTWDNKKGTADHNETSLNVTVKPTYILDVLQENITSTVAAGKKKNIENMTVRSFGNAPLENVTFNVTGFVNDFNFTFIPVNFSSLQAGNMTQVRIYLEVSDGYPPGDYSGIMNVTSGNDGYEELPVNITVSGTNMTLDVSLTNFTAENITYYVAQNFSMDVNTTNVGNATAYSVNITLNFSKQYIYTSNTTNYECGDKVKSEYCSGSFIITVSNGTPSGNYTINVSVVWDNPEIGIRANWSIVNITVLSNVNLTIPEDELKGNITHGTTDILGNFTMNSTGNDKIEGMEFIVEDPAGQLKDFDIKIIPNITETAGGNLSAGAALVINVSVEVPLSYPPGVYNGFLNVTTNNSGYKNLSLEITVPTSRTWVVEHPSDLYCEHVEAPEYGIVCNVTINNTGNVNITFNITPDWASEDNEYNNTWPEFVDFEVENQTTFKLTIYYNVTGDELVFYNATYQISGQQADPPWMNLTVSLTPKVKPLIDVLINPAILPQQNTTQILVYVTDQAGIAGINKTEINVTRPDATLDQIEMRYVGGTDPYIYEAFYPVDPPATTWGNTTARGNYTVVVYAEDNFGQNDTNQSSFYVHAALLVELHTTRTSGEYYQGEHGTISYKVTDLAGLDMPVVNVSILIKDPTNRSVKLNNGKFMTNSQGEPDAYPDFELFADSPTGIYNITAVSVFNDTPVGQICTNTSVANFTVVERKPGMLLLDLEAPAETSISDGLEVVAMITDGVANVDPDSIMVSLYDPLDNLILENQSMTKLSTGRYTRWYNTSASSNQGNWRWVVTITKDGNVITKDVYTRLVGGPFDVRDITIIDNTIPDLAISVIIENTGDMYQDAYVQWNLTRTDTGEMLKEGLDTVRIEANSEYTYTANPTGVDYIGEVKIMFIVTYSGTERAGAYEIFNTAEEAPPAPPRPPREREEPAPVGPVGPLPKPGIEIIDYPEEIATEAGWAQYPSVTVNNTGNGMLHQVMLTIAGIPSSWFDVSPIMIPLLKPGESKTFVINLLVPEGTEARKYYGTFNATANETYDEKLTAVIVFGSREELVRYELEKLKEEFKEFKEDVNATAEEGKKDLTRVYGIIDEIQYQIDLTEGYLDAKMFDEALDSVTTGWRLLERGRELLRAAPPIKPVTILVIPDWMITLIMLLIIAILALLLLTSKYKKKLERIFKRGVPETRYAKEAIGAGPAVKAAEEEEAAATARREAEREKIKKVLNLLDREYNEGIISEKAYNELRKRNLEKFKDLGRET